MAGPLEQRSPRPPCAAAPLARPPAAAGVLWFARAAFAVVFCWNVLCALQFVIDPASYAGAYQLDGAPGAAAIRGLGVAFLMWNTTYPLFILQPWRYRVLGGVILVQQAVGLVGELAILGSLPAGCEVLAASIARFAAFDGAGLALMGAAFIALRPWRPR